MSIQNIPSHDTDRHNFLISHQGEIASVLFGPQKKRVSIKKGNIKKIARGLSEIAFSIGQTNDFEAFEEELAEDIFQALEQVKQRQSKKTKKG